MGLCVGRRTRSGLEIWGAPGFVAEVFKCKMKDSGFWGVGFRVFASERLRV